MKYITSVKEGLNIKHIVEVNGKNVEVVQVSKPEDYGNIKGERVFSAIGIKVSKDFRFSNDSDSSYDYIHLAKAVFAIELVRFVSNHLKGNDHE